MKYSIKVIIAFATAASIASCTNTESTMGSNTTMSTTEGSTTENQSNTQQSRETDMSTESEAEQLVSVDNKLGRNQNIVALLQQNQNLSIFVDLIRASDMVVTLESATPYTVFAPTNQAFASLPSGTIETLKAPGNKLELTRLIQAHVIPNRITSAEMNDNMAMRTATGEDVMVKKNGSNITVGGAQLTITDVKASNGVVHVINKLLVPPER